MIKTKADLKSYLSRDMAFYWKQPRQDRIVCRLTKDPIYYIARYVRLLRHEEYYFNSGKGLLSKLLFLHYFRKKNALGNVLGFKIPKNCFGPGLTIFHHGYIIINEAARIGCDCILHGDNCIGNNGTDDVNPVIGDGLDLGVGAKIVGAVKLGNRIVVGANAVVVKSCDIDGSVLAGIPAKRISREID